VTTPDLVALRRTAAFVETLARRQGESALRSRLALVLNRYRSRQHPDAAEIAEVLRLPVAAAIPDDPEALQQALELQRPVVACSAGRGAGPRALLGLAAAIEAAQTAGSKPASSGFSRLLPRLIRLRR
jgi:Flp pilus assembly CpaE family ATPase